MQSHNSIAGYWQCDYLSVEATLQINKNSTELEEITRLAKPDKTLHSNGSYIALIFAALKEI
ncbi:MAG: hypothetical protein PUP91_17150 [Rhizonema sp. PD37]|nr:hypothetical protein [Rhizonema sp. PD37]